MNHSITFRRKLHKRAYMNKSQRAQQWNENFHKVLLMCPIHLKVKKLFSGKRQEKEINLHNNATLLNYQNIPMKIGSKKLDLQHQQITQIHDHLLINVFKSPILKKREQKYQLKILQLEKC